MVRCSQKNGISYNCLFVVLNIFNIQNVNFICIWNDSFFLSSNYKFSKTKTILLCIPSSIFCNVNIFTSIFFIAYITCPSSFLSQSTLFINVTTSTNVLQRFTHVNTHYFTFLWVLLQRRKRECRNYCKKNRGFPSCFAKHFAMLSFPSGSHCSTIFFFFRFSRMYHVFIPEKWDLNLKNVTTEP